MECALQRRHGLSKCDGGELNGMVESTPKRIVMVCDRHERLMMVSMRLC